MGNDVDISRIKYLSTIVEQGKNFTTNDAVHSIVIELISRSIAVGVDSKQLRDKNYVTRYISYMAVVSVIKSDYIIYFEMDILNIDTIEIVAFNTKDDNIRYHYKNGNEYDISDTIEDEFLDEYNLIKEIVKEIASLLGIIYVNALVYFIPTNIITNRFASDFEE